MCFYHEDADWTASVYEDEENAPTDKAAKCDECRAIIRVGEPRRHVYMQEHEGCIRCDRDARDSHQERSGDYDEEDDDGNLPSLTPCEDGKHDYGETFECDICENCQKLLLAIAAAEADEGCDPHESQPSFGAMFEEMNDGGEAITYIDRARDLFPELAMNGYLDRVHHRYGEWDDEFWEEEVWDDVVRGPDGELGGEGG